MVLVSASPTIGGNEGKIGARKLNQPVGLMTVVFDKPA
jgi:hypothetical protein